MGVIISAPYIDLSQIVNASKPTTRIDGSALVTGDRWYSPTTGIEATWNGTYWLSPLQHAPLSAPIINTNLVTGGQSRWELAIPQAYNYYLVDLCVTFYNSGFFGGVNASNYLTLNFSRLINRGNVQPLSNTYNTFSGAGEKTNKTYAGETIAGFYQLTFPINTFIQNSPTFVYQNYGLVIAATATGSVSGSLTVTTGNSFTFQYVL